MAEQLQTLIRTWQISGDIRSEVTLVDNIRLDSRRNVIELVRDDDLGYPITGDQYVILPSFAPASVRSWLMIQSSITHRRVNGSIVTAAGFRLHDGANQWYWDGAAWAISVVAWNTEAEINENIADFDATTRTIRIVVRLSSTDAACTPELNWVKLAWRGRASHWLEDLLYRTLVPYFRQVTSTVDMAVVAPDPADVEVPLSASIQSAGIPFTITDCDAVFNYTNDPGRHENLLASWDQSTKTATLTVAQTAGEQLVAELRVRPVVAVEATSQDYTEVERAHGLLITDVTDTNSSPIGDDDGVVNNTTGATIRLSDVSRCDVSFSMIVSTAGAVDLARLLRNLLAYVKRNPIIRANATDEPYRLQLMTEIGTSTVPNNADVHTSKLTALIHNVIAPNSDAVEEMGVTSVTTTFDT